MTPFDAFKYNIKVSYNNSDLLKTNSINPEESRRISESILTVLQQEQKLTRSNITISISDLPKSPIVDEIKRLANQNLSDQAQDIIITISPIIQAHGLSKFRTGHRICTLKTKKYTEGEIIAEQYRYVGPKDAGFEPGFKAKKAWKISDESKLDQSEHRFHTYAKNWIQQQLKKSLDDELNVEKSFITAIMDLNLPNLSLVKQARLDQLLSEGSYDTLIKIPEIRNLIISDLLASDLKFNKIHYVKGDYIKLSKNAVSIPLSHIKSNILVKKYQQFVRRKSYRQKNLDAVVEVLANDIYNALDFGGLRLKLIETFYEDGRTRKLLLDGTEIRGSKGEKFNTFKGQIKKGTLIHNSLKNESGKMVPIDTAHLGAGKIIALLNGDWDRFGNTGENIGYIVDKKTDQVKLINIDPGHALKYPEYFKPSPQKNNIVKYFFQYLIYRFNRFFFENSLLSFKNIHNNFSIDQPHHHLFHLAIGGYLNFTCFDDTLITEKMAGVRRIIANWNKIEDIFDAYIKTFSIKGNLFFKQELEMTKRALTDRKNYILNIFKDRLNLNNEELILLDNFEKLTSSTKNYVIINKKKYYFQHLRVKTHSRHEWKMQKNENGFLLEFASQKRFGAHREAKKVSDRLRKHAVLFNDDSSPFIISRRDNKVSFQIQEKDFNHFCYVFSEASIATTKKQKLYTPPSISLNSNTS